MSLHQWTCSSKRCCTADMIRLVASRWVSLAGPECSATGKIYAYMLDIGPTHDPFMLRYSQHVWRPINLQAIRCALISQHVQCNLPSPLQPLTPVMCTSCGRKEDQCLHVSPHEKAREASSNLIAMQRGRSAICGPA